ncbi:MAG: DNA recombination protein RmuC [Patescibacteria group bacterium]|nr:DNA recombination protein RmuC [Patescibacteria group bacterium]
MNLFVLIILVAVGFVILLFFINAKFQELKKSASQNQEQKIMLSLISELRREVHDSSGKSRRETQEKLDRITDSLNRGLTHSSRSIERQFRQSQALIKETVQKISAFEQTNKKIAGFAGQLQSLENILKNPKQRGVLGEYYLETMLKNVFEPGQYKMQYKFKNGAIVDAAIFYQKKILPVDSKFSMENYNKMIQEQDPDRKKNLARQLISDIKKRIIETSKYIRPKEDTFDFAFMFIPSEGLFYDLLTAEVGALRELSTNIIEFALKKNVIPVSPSSFYAYLQTILHGLRAVEMKESVTVILKKVSSLDKHLKVYEAYFSKLGGHLGTAVSAYNKTSKEFAKIDKDIYRITEGKNRDNLKTTELEKPELE